MAAVCVCLIGISTTNTSFSQVRWAFGGNMGLSVASGGGLSSAGLHLGPMGEVLIGKGPAIGTEININTQTGTPIEWANYFKWYFAVPGSKIKPYANGGFGLYFFTGGPYFDLRFGGGAQFPVGRNLYIPAELQLGPIFATGTTGFVFIIRGGVRYEL
jgi:hypothetical protein